MSKATISSDLFSDYSTSTFVQWDGNTLNTPFKAGLTGGQEGFALVVGKKSGWQTVVAWVKGGTQASGTWIHTYDNGKDYGWRKYTVSTDLSSLVKWMGISIPIGALAAGAEKFAQTFEFNIDDGYTSAALTGFTLGGTGYTDCSITKCFLLGNKVGWSVKNLGTAATGDDLELDCQIMLIKKAFTA